MLKIEAFNFKLERPYPGHDALSADGWPLNQYARLFGCLERTLSVEAVLLYGRGAGRLEMAACTLANTAGKLY